MSVDFMLYIKAFLFGGIVCALCQLFLDKTKFTPGHLLSGLTVLGGILGGFGIYDKLIKTFGGGASMLISSFGNSLVKGAISEVKKNGILGVLTGMFEFTSAGITAAIVFSFLCSIVFKPKG